MVYLGQHYWESGKSNPFYWTAKSKGCILYFWWQPLKEQKTLNNLNGNEDEIK